MARMPTLSVPHCGSLLYNEAVVMEDSSLPTEHNKCPFCRMPSMGRFLRIPVCAICRDQLYDFI